MTSSQTIDDFDSISFRERWDIRSDTLYLNHGSFGPAPLEVLEVQRGWQKRLNEQPMDFFLRQLPNAWSAARRRLAAFVGTSEQNLVFAENSTQAMNVVAHSYVLAPGDEVLLTNHEYGAVRRIWERRAKLCGAVCCQVDLPFPSESAESVVDAIADAITPKTRLVIVSHITSPTAIILPVERICRAAAKMGVPVCIDGPHAVAQIPLNIDLLECAFYTASCHKWLSAPLGSGFLYVHPTFQTSIEPPSLSWGVLQPAVPARWDEEFIWLGTRDPSAYLTIPAAIDFLESVGMENFRRRTHALARYARERLLELFPGEPLVPDSSDWYGSMAQVPLPIADSHALQDSLWRQFGIEVPIVRWNERIWIRVSCHLYNRKTDIDRLIDALTGKAVK